MEKGWDYPQKGFVKINVHSFTMNEHLPNGNNSGIGIVVRDDEGIIIKMVSGSIQNLTARENELWGLLAGLRTAFFEGLNSIELETDNSEAVKE